MVLREAHAPVITGLVVGVTFLLIVGFAINAPLPLRYGHANTPTDEDRGKLLEMLNLSRQLEPVSLFLGKYPFATIQIYQYGNSPVYDEQDTRTGSEFRATFVFSGPRITRIEYQEVSVNNLLISYHHPSLWVTVDGEGNLEDQSLRCGISYLDNSGSFQSVVNEYDVVIDFLRSKVCWR